MTDWNAARYHEISSPQQATVSEFLFLMVMTPPNTGRGHRQRPYFVAIIHASRAG